MYPSRSHTDSFQKHPFLKDTLEVQLDHNSYLSYFSCQSFDIRFSKLKFIHLFEAKENRWNLIIIRVKKWKQN